MSANMKTIQSGGTIWGMVKAANPGASDAQVQQLTQKVLDSNGLTWDSAKTLHAGDKVDLTAAMGGGAAKATQPAAPAKPAQQAPTFTTNGDPTDELKYLQFLLGGATGQQQPNGANNNPFAALSSLFGTGGNGGLDSFLNAKGLGKGTNSSLLAQQSGNFAFNATGQQFLPFANPFTILNNVQRTIGTF